jgi:DNA mismatch repair protein MutS
VQTIQCAASGDAGIELPLATRRNLELTQTLRGEDSPRCFR